MESMSARAWARVTPGWSRPKAWELLDAAIEERRVVPLADRGIDIALDAVESKFWRKDTRNGVVRPVQVDGVADDVR